MSELHTLNFGNKRKAVLRKENEKQNTRIHAYIQS